MRNDEGQGRRPKAKRCVVMTMGGHGGMACMAQEYHGDGDVDGPLRKIGNVGVRILSLLFRTGRDLTPMQGPSTPCTLKVPPLLKVGLRLLLFFEEGSSQI
jgi:hypothetical protein